jgi:hypothetical protein
MRGMAANYHDLIYPEFEKHSGTVLHLPQDGGSNPKIKQIIWCIFVGPYNNNLASFATRMTVFPAATLTVQLKPVLPALVESEP